MTVYVKIEEYQKVRDNMTVLKAKMSDAKRLLRRLNEIKNKENNYLAEWETQINLAEEKIHKISNVLG